jgi:hypothetical protein
MAFDMGFSRASLTSPIAQTGLYELQVNGFRPKLTKKGDGVNYNVETTIVNNPGFTANGAPLEGIKVFHPLSTKFSIAIWDFVHACGLEMEEVLVPGDAQTDQHTTLVLPGVWEGAAANPEDPSQWGEYKGPLLNVIFKADVIESSFNGKPKNEIRAFLCALDGCAERYPDVRHSNNLCK